MEGKACILKDFLFIDMNLVALMYTILAFLSAIGLKKNNYAFKGHKDHFFAFFSFFFFQLSK